MVLVTGGCFQGKKEYASETFGIPLSEAADGKSCGLEEIFHTRLLYHFHEYIRRLVEMGMEFPLEELRRRNPDLVLVTNELGCGVVPVDRFDREYRERTGRICCQIARISEVHRVVCGLGTVIRHG